MNQPITGLYVPGDRPDRFAKAVATGADLVVFDLEDAVPPAHKDAARQNVVAYLSSADLSCVIQVRVNPADAPAGQADLAMLRTLPATVELRLPKVERPSQIDQALAQAGPRPVTALLESPAAVLAAADIAAVLAADITASGGSGIAVSGGVGRQPVHETAPDQGVSVAASGGISRLGLGESDLSSAFGVRSGPLIDHARLHLAYVVRAAGLPAPMLSPYPDIADLDGLRRDTEHGRQLGWIGRLAIHPAQLPVIAAVFAPSAAQVTWAESVLAALAQAAGGVATLATGEMVDPAMCGRAESILRRHTTA
ncbi:MAG: CoA ester lyase [Propionibacteriaceae bacterium]|jgi:citrate lyase subunit beta/citryl-CoA lyase|nr:CoA ester lyase [Propionibacteriaceae bacterium]